MMTPNEIRLLLKETLGLSIGSIIRFLEMTNKNGQQKLINSLKRRKANKPLSFNEKKELILSSINTI